MARDDVRFEPGDVLAGRYQVEIRLGGGAQGEVFRAYDQALKKPVALKFLPKDAENDPEKLERLLHEVRTAQDVTHPNVLRIYDLAQADGRRFVSMELVEGWSLAGLLRVAAPLSPPRALAYADALCQGLDAMMVLFSGSRGRPCRRRRQDLPGAGAEEPSKTVFKSPGSQPCGRICRNRLSP